jgi:tRNA threonylcarbamoyladenosine biosynthesis protein TsaB
MWLLAIETSRNKCSVALFSQGKFINMITEERAHKQSERLLLMIEEVLAGQGIEYSDLSYVAVCVGPGSFTGVRIGLATAIGIEIAKGTQVIAVSSLEAIAVENCWSLINAGRGEFYAEQFSASNQVTSSPELLNAELVSSLRENGEKLIELGVEVEDLTAKQVGEAAFKRIKLGLFLPVAPLYIREPDAKLPKDA